MLINGYSDFLLEAPGCHPGIVQYRADFKLDANVTHLFPYINAVAENATYYDAPLHIQFFLHGCRCALYPDKVVAALFEDREQALRFIQRLIDFLNDLHSRQDSIEPNHQMYKPLPVLDIYRLLSRSNCQACGFSTCMAFAVALSQGETSSVECPELGDPANENAVKLQSLIESA